MQEIHFDIVRSPFGLCVIGLMGREVCSLLFMGRDREAQARKLIRECWPKATLVRDPVRVRAIARKIFGRKGATSAITLHLEGTPFQLKVWNALRSIPAGKTSTYAAIAKRIGSPNAFRAVGTACGKNPIGYLIPCHRILASDGGPGGYRWGLKRKAAILAWETSRK